MAAMEPRIRYARARDGTAVAYWSLGEGPNVVHLPWLPWSHVQLEWNAPEMHDWYERLATSTRLVRYDGRGTGLSDRVSKSYGVDAQMLDIDAVVEHLEMERFALLAVLNMGPAAISYAVRNPKRVSHLILWCTYASNQDYASSPQVQAIRGLLERDWNLYIETAAHSFVGWDAGAAAHRLAYLMQESVTEDVAKAFMAEMRLADCSALLSQVSVPTLVLHPRQFSLISIDIARSLTASIPDARLELFEGASLSPARVDLEGVASKIADFLAEPSVAQPLQEGAAQAPRPRPGRHPDGLSRREVEVLALLARGLSNREIAANLVLSARTVERHIANIYAKLNVNGRVQATAYALSNDVV
jgi:DNA-binding CsgD family transcriptional regulator/pimeloyl-ACP methyl ester carboxylesterase